MPAKIVKTLADLDPVIDGEDAQRFANVDLAALKLYGQDMDVRLERAVTAGQVEQSIERASTITLTVHDQARELISKNRFANQKFDIKVDGVWLRLAGISKQGDDFTLTFEDRVVAWMRGYSKPKKAFRDKITRAEFVFGMVDEVEEGTIPFYSPELTKVQPIRGAAETKRRTSPRQQKVAEKRSDAAREPAVGGETATLVGGDNGQKIFCFFVANGFTEQQAAGWVGNFVQESSLNPASGGGYLAQWQGARASGLASFARRKGTSITNLLTQLQYVLFELNGPESGARGPIKAAKTIADATLAISSRYERPSLPNNPRRINEAQKAYARYRGKCGTATASDSTSDTSRTVTKTKRYAFSRGQNGTEESTWEASRRLAEEVGWRRFAIAGTFFLIAEEDLFLSRPRMVLSEDTPGVEWIDYDIIMGRRPPKKRVDTKNPWVAEMTVQARASRWVAPPGTVVLVEDMGPADGKWLVVSRSRSLFDTLATIQLRKPIRELPEPAPETVQVRQKADQQDASSGAGSSKGGQVTGSGIRQFSWPTPPQYRSISSPFGPRGGRNHDGIDLPYPNGTIVRSAAPGRVAVAGGSTGGYGVQIVINHGNGFSTRYAHLQRLGVNVGQQVARGEIIARGDSTGNSTGPHLHFEVMVNGSPRNPVPYIN